MPAQDIDAERVVASDEPESRWRMSVVITAALLLTLIAGAQMFGLLAAEGMAPLEWMLLCVFSLNFAWVSAAGVTAVAGAVVLATQRTRPADTSTLRTQSRTALLFPIYNEDPESVMDAAEAIHDDLRRIHADRAFDVFFLSDTRSPELARIERGAFARRLASRPHLPFFYRRRAENTHRKAGNIADFVRRWGGRYDYMVVLDADSLMTAQALSELVRRMDQRPRTALIQTMPTIIGARSLFARSQQFALRAYGAIFSAGVAWWSAGAGNYWGHNAIIRVKAFAAHAGLPDLPGVAPLGGPILSHDFVEAAMLRRAGWRVEIATDIDGSYEQGPPTLIDMSIRDRRWAQGNLQHLGLLFAKGFAPASRAHLFAGVMSYLSSVLWLGLILTGAAVAMTTEPVETSEGLAALGLLTLTSALLLAPKWLALGLWLAGKLPGWTGDPRFVGGLLVEAVLSTVMAPVVMLSQALAVLDTLLGRDGGWPPQVRERRGIPLGQLVRCYGPHMLLGLALLVGAVISPAAAPWTAPVIASLLAAPVVVFVLSLQQAAAGVLSRVMMTPEDVAPPRLMLLAHREIDAVADHGPLDGLAASQVQPSEIA